LAFKYAGILATTPTEQGPAIALGMKNIVSFTFKNVFLKLPFLSWHSKDLMMTCWVAKSFNTGKCCLERQKRWQICGVSGWQLCCFTLPGWQLLDSG
jgi:hypothetical protein